MQSPIKIAQFLREAASLSLMTLVNAIGSDTALTAMSAHPGQVGASGLRRCSVLKNAKKPIVDITKIDAPT